MFCCLQFRKRKNYDYFDFQFLSVNELKSVEELIVIGGRGFGLYENIVILDYRDIVRCVQQEQDKIGCYVRDFMGKKVRSYFCYFFNGIFFFYY